LLFSHSVTTAVSPKTASMRRTTHQKFITDKHPEITTVPYDSYQNAKLDLQNGRSHLSSLFPAQR
jgi:arginine transport system substrate-binding protein